MLTGGDGYTSLGKGKMLIGDTDGKLLANEVMTYVRKARHGRREGRRPHRHPLMRALDDFRPAARHQRWAMWSEDLAGA